VTSSIKADFEMHMQSGLWMTVSH